MTKPKGFTAMCGLGLTLYGLSVIYSSAVLALIALSSMGALGGSSTSFLDGLSPAKLGITTSRYAILTEGFYVMAGSHVFVSLYDMLAKRRNNLPYLILWLKAELFFTLVDAFLLMPDDLATRITTILLAISLFAVGYFYFRRRRVSAYLVNQPTPWLERHLKGRSQLAFPISGTTVIEGQQNRHVRTDVSHQ